jgi:protein involved in polysaccharide export with SLBB domain
MLRTLAIVSLVLPVGYTLAAGQTAPDSRSAAQLGGAALQPGDAVKLSVWREPDLSGEFPVNQRGEVVFPKIGKVQVANLTADSLSRMLVTTYSEFLRYPSIDVVVLRRVTVSGAVKNPGLYPVDPTMTVADAVALAGGATPQGKLDRVVLLRDGKTLLARLQRQARLGETPLRSGDQLFVPERGWLSRNPWVVAAVVGAVATVALQQLTN